MNSLIRFPKRLAGVYTILLLFCGTNLQSQTPTDFSGKWKFDKSKSTQGGLEAGYPGTIIRTIVQTADTFKYADLYRQAGSNDWNTEFEKFSLDGKTAIDKGDYSTIKKKTEWSADKKTLTTISISVEKSGGSEQEFLIEDTYLVSPDGKSLIIERRSKNPVEGEKSSRMVYHRL